MERNPSSLHIRCPIQMENGHDPRENDVFASDGHGLVCLSQTMMQPEECFCRREWLRKNAIHLEEEGKKEKEMRKLIFEEAEEYLCALYEKRNLKVETMKTSNRAKEELYVASLQKFHENADKHCWQAIAELIPGEIPYIDKNRNREQQDKKPAIRATKGPKPGTPTDLSRMWKLLMKLKHDPFPHAILSRGNDAAVPAGADATQELLHIAA